MFEYITLEMFEDITLEISKVGPIGIFPLVAGGPQGIVICKGRDEFLAPDDADNGFVFPHEFLHFFLDEGVVFEHILEMFLAVGQILFQPGVLVDKVMVNPPDFLTFLPDLVQIFALVSNALLYLFCIDKQVLITPANSLYFSVSIFAMFRACFVSFIFF